MADSSSRAPRSSSSPAPPPSRRGGASALGLERASTIPARWYTDPAHFLLERARVLDRAWHLVSHNDQLAQRGSYASAEIGAEPVVVVRGDDDVIRAFSNVCRHRAGQVVAAGSSGCARALQCRYHGWTYGLDGCLLGAPEMQDAVDFDREDFGLRPLRAAVWQRSVFASLDDAAPSLASLLASVPAADAAALAKGESWPHALTQRYDIACNWKVYVDNFLEAYHVPRAHPGLHRVLDYKRYVVEPSGPLVIQRAPGRAKGDPGSFYLWLFPLFMLNINPGYVQTNAIIPLAVDKTRVVFEFFFPPRAKRSAIDACVAFSDEVQAEDVVLCEAVQKNLGSRFYEAGRYSPRRENGVFHFHELLRAALAATDSRSRSRRR